jgi:hypothetical protein
MTAPPDVAILTPAQIIAFAQDRVRESIGKEWSIVSVAIFPLASLIRITVIDTTEAEDDLVAIMPIEVIHPAAVVSAVILQWRLRHDPDAIACFDQTYPDDDEADDRDIAAEALRYDA